MISVLILRSVESEQTSRENQPLHASPWTRCGGYPYRTALCPRKDFSSDSPTKILCHLGISQQGLARVYWMVPESQCFPRHRQAPFSGPSQGEPILGLPPLLPRVAASFCENSCTTSLDVSWCPSLPLSFWGSVLLSSHYLCKLRKQMSFLFQS